MAVVRPLVVNPNTRIIGSATANPGDLIQMTNAQVAAIKTRMYWLYIGNPIVSLSVVSGGGNLTTMSDTRLEAGTATSQLHSANPLVGPVTTVTVAYNNILQTVGTQADPNTRGTTYPLYYGPDGNIKVMSSQDMFDTFCYDVINGGYTMADGMTTAPGLAAASSIYTVASSGTSSPPAVSGYTLVSPVAIFTDTRANLAAYTAAGIPEPQDLPTLIMDYFLYRQNTVNTAYDIPVTINTFGNFQPTTQSAMDSILLSAMNYLVTTSIANSAGYGLGYAINGTGATCGTVMTDTRLDGTNEGVTVYTAGSEYLAQEFPAGNPIVVSTYVLTQQRI